MRAAAAPLLLLASATLHAASELVPIRGGGAKPDPAVAVALPDRAYEPWTADARVGDFVVREHADGRRERRGITAVDADAVSVRERWFVGDRLERTDAVRYRRAAKPDDIPETLDLVLGKGGTCVVAGRSIACAQWSGWRVLAALAEDRRLAAVKLGRLERAVSADVPLDGIVREAEAPDDGLPTRLAPSPGALVEVFDREDQPRVVFDLVDFGRGPRP